MAEFDDIFGGAKRQFEQDEARRQAGLEEQQQQQDTEERMRAAALEERQKTMRFATHARDLLVEGRVEPDLTGWVHKQGLLRSKLTEVPIGWKLPIEPTQEFTSAALRTEGVVELTRLTSSGSDGRSETGGDMTRWAFDEQFEKSEVEVSPFVFASYDKVVQSGIAGLLIQHGLGPQE